MCKTAVSLFLILIVLHQIIAIESGYAETRSEKQERLAAEIKSRVEGFGVGAVVAVYRQNNGVKDQGTIAEISDASFKLLQDGGNKLIPYASANGVVLAQPKYKAGGTPDPVRVRQCVVNLGVGKNAAIKVRGEPLNGRIESIGKENFTILSSRSGRTQTVNFTEVTEVKAKTFPKWAIGAIVGGVVVGALMGAMVAACGVDGC